MAKFEWDPRKDRINLEKHGIDFLTALELWSGPTYTMDTYPGNDAHRYLVVGELRGWCWTAVITLRGDSIRIISVRRSRRNEKEAFNEHTRNQRGDWRHNDWRYGGGDR